MDEQLTKYLMYDIIPTYGIHKNTKLRKVGFISLWERDGETKMSKDEPNEEEHGTGWELLSTWKQYRNT